MVISVFGLDHPGIVAGVSQILAEASCSIIDINQTVVQGKFAMVIIADTSRARESTTESEGSIATRRPETRRSHLRAARRSLQRDAPDLMRISNCGLWMYSQFAIHISKFLMSDPEIARRCTACGVSVRQHAMFCPQCGNPIGQSPATTHAVSDTIIDTAPTEALTPDLAATQPLSAIVSVQPTRRKPFDRKMACAVEWRSCEKFPAS